MSIQVGEATQEQLVTDEIYSHSAVTSMEAYILQAQWRYSVDDSLNDALYETARRRQQIFADANTEIDAGQSSIAMLVNASRMAYRYMNQEWRHEILAQDRLADPGAQLRDVPHMGFRLRWPRRFVSLPPGAQAYVQEYFIIEDATQQVAS
ncbi:hypothetical protein KC963_05005 [Candidatus Saccharibacteria bacterium]|nr:hypothetical protein [Candidatus Saccharibacteria bacterium]